MYPESTLLEYVFLHGQVEEDYGRRLGEAVSERGGEFRNKAMRLSGWHKSESQMEVQGTAVSAAPFFSIS